MENSVCDNSLQDQWPVACFAGLSGIWAKWVCSAQGPWRKCPGQRWAETLHDGIQARTACKDWLTAFRHYLILSRWCTKRGHVTESSVFPWTSPALGVPAARNTLPTVPDGSLQPSVNPRQALRLSSTWPYTSPPPCPPPCFRLTLDPTDSKECFGQTPPGQSSVTPALCWELRDKHAIASMKQVLELTRTFPSKQRKSLVD